MNESTSSDYQVPVATNVATAEVLLHFFAEYEDELDRRRSREGGKRRDGHLVSIPT